MASRHDSDLSWYEKNRANENIIKTAEFRSAKKIEEDALMAALGLKIMPPPAGTSQSKSVIKREPQSTSIKNEPMTPAVHHDSRKSKSDRHRQEDRRQQRQSKTTGSDEDENNWSENDEEDLMDEDYDNSETRQSVQSNMSTEKELDEFLLDLIKKHGLKSIKHALKSKEEKKDRKHDQSSSESEDEKQRSHKKHKHKSKHSHREDSRSSKRHRSPSSSKHDRSKRHHDRSS